MLTIEIMNSYNASNLRLSSQSPNSDRSSLRNPPIQLDGPRTPLPTAREGAQRTIATPPHYLVIPRTRESESQTISHAEVPHTYWAADQEMSPPLVQYHMSYHLQLNRSTLQPSSAGHRVQLNERSASVPEVSIHESSIDSRIDSHLNEPYTVSVMTPSDAADYFTITTKMELGPPSLEELQEEFPRLFARDSPRLAEALLGMHLDVVTQFNVENDTIKSVLVLEVAVAEYLKLLHHNFRNYMDRPLPGPLLVPVTLQVLGMFTESIQLHLINLLRQIQVEYRLLGSLILLFNKFVDSEVNEIKEKVANLKSNPVNYSRVMFEALKQFKKIVITFNPFLSPQGEAPTLSPFATNINSRSDEESTRVILVDLVDNIATRIGNLIREYNDIIEDEYLFLEGDAEEANGVDNAYYDIKFVERDAELREMAAYVEKHAGNDGDRIDNGFENPSNTHFALVVDEVEELFKEYIDATSKMLPTV